jgi:two-component system, cell cycle response regulator DivK
MRDYAVLVVDDDDNTIDLITSTLKQMGITAYWAHDGGEGLRLAHEVKPDLIIMDLYLPSNIKGWEAIDMLKHNPASRHIPVLALTAGSGDALEKAYIAGCDAWVQKPFAMRDLKALIEQFRR